MGVFRSFLSFLPSSGTPSLLFGSLLTYLLARQAGADGSHAKWLLQPGVDAAAVANCLHTATLARPRHHLFLCPTWPSVLIRRPERIRHVRCETGMRNCTAVEKRNNEDRYSRGVCRAARYRSGLSPEVEYSQRNNSRGAVDDDLLLNGRSAVSILRTEVRVHPAIRTTARHSGALTSPRFYHYVPHISYLFIKTRELIITEGHRLERNHTRTV